MRVYAQRKIDSDCDISEESKKQRTADADLDSATKTEPVDGTVSAVSAQIESPNAEDENCMSVDLVHHTDGTTAVSSPDNVSSDRALSSVAGSTAANVIDVDAINEGDGCDEAGTNGTSGYGNPLEMGLNEYYLQPASGDAPTEDVIDVDAEAVDGLLGLSVSGPAAENTSVAETDARRGEVEGIEVPPVDTEAETEADELNDDRSTEAAASEVGNDESVARSHPSSAGKNQTSSPDVASSDTVEQLVADDKVEGNLACSVEGKSSDEKQQDTQTLDAADIGDIVCEVIDDVVADERLGSHETSAIELDGEAPPDSTAKAGDDTEADGGNPQPATGLEVEVWTTVQETSPPGDIGETVEEPPVWCDRDKEQQSEDEKVVGSADSSLVDPSSKSLNQEECTLLVQCESSTGDGDDKDVKDVIVAATSNDAYLAEVTDKSVSDNTETPSNVECAMEVIEMEDTNKAAASDDRRAEVVDVTDKPVIDTNDMSQSSKPADVIVVAEDTKSEATDTEATDSIEQHSDELQTVVSGDIEPEAAEPEQTADQPGDGSPTEDVKEVMVIDLADEMVKPAAVENVGDILKPKDLIDVASSGDIEVEQTAVSCEENVAQFKDVPDSTEIAEQPMEMIAETDHGERCKETRDVTVIDSVEVTDSTDEIKSGVMSVTDKAVIGDAREPKMKLKDELSTTTVSKDTAVSVVMSEGRVQEKMEVMTDNAENGAEDTEPLQVNDAKVTQATERTVGSTSVSDTCVVEQTESESSAAGGDGKGGDEAETEMDVAV